MAARAWRGAALALLALLALAGAARGVFDDLHLAPDARAPFEHGVGSADPLPDSVLLWTRLTLAGRPAEARVQWRLWDPADPAQGADSPLRQGEAPVLAADDWTVTIDVRDLAPGTRYLYQFFFEGAPSRQGRTKTAPVDGPVSLAFLSCTSLWSGYFNFYQALAQDDSLDAVVHLGDFSYPDIDPDEVYRVPSGLCEDPHWFEPANRDVGGKAADNSLPFLREKVEALNCSGSDLHRYRWVHSLYMLDPDFRDARAMHPFIVTLDNHDLAGRESDFAGSRKAALEWVPMRVTTRVAPDGSEHVRSLRNMQFGDGLVDLVMLDTYSESAIPEEGGLLGESQHAWLDQVLANSTAKWRVFGSAKAFMPFTINGVPRGLDLMFGLVFLSLLALLLVCLGIENQCAAHFASEAIVNLDDSLTHKNSLVSVTEPDPEEIVAELAAQRAQRHPIRTHLATARTALAQQRKAMQRSHANSPRTLRRCTCLGLVLVIVSIVIWIAAAIGLRILLNGEPGLKYLDGGEETWEGQPASRDRLFDQLIEHGVESNNIWAVGDMHFSYAADVLRFNAAGKDLLDYNPFTDNPVERFGVEILPGSGSRGNLDEKMNEILGFVRPGTPLGRLASNIADHVVSTANPHFRWFEGSGHGYGVLRFAHEKPVQAQFMQFPILERIEGEVVAEPVRVFELHDGDNLWTDPLE